MTNTILHSLPIHAHNLLKWQGLKSNDQIIAHMKSDTIDNLAQAAVYTVYNRFCTVKQEDKLARATAVYTIIAGVIADYNP